MKNFKSIYFETDSGRRPVEEFINSLQIRTQNKYFVVVELLEELGKRLPEPHAKDLGDGIYELRFSGIEGKVRILYFFYYENKIIFTNGFVKKTGRIPQNELETAKGRRKVYLGRCSKI